MKMIEISMLLLMLFFVSGCDELSGPTAEQKDKVSVETQQQQYVAAQPIPSFDWSLERDVAIQLYAARNERVATWTVWRSDLGTIEGHCESVGYPIPYDVQLTNPLKSEWKRYQSYSSAVVEQPEPNGLYSSHNSVATWVRSIRRENGKAVEVPIYIESKVTCYPYPIEVDYEKNRVTPVADASPTVTIKRK